MKSRLLSWKEERRDNLIENGIREKVVESERGEQEQELEADAKDEEGIEECDEQVEHRERSDEEESSDHNEFHRTTRLRVKQDEESVRGTDQKQGRLYGFLDKKQLPET